MMYNIVRNLQGAKLYVSQCCHSKICQPYCITGSAIVALQTSFSEADTIAQNLAEQRLGNWSIEPVIDQPSTLTIYLGSEVSA
jgi:hypothetical protein